MNIGTVIYYYRMIEYGCYNINRFSLCNGRRTYRSSDLVLEKRKLLYYSTYYSTYFTTSACRRYIPNTQIVTTKNWVPITHPYYAIHVFFNNHHPAVFLYKILIIITYFNYLFRDKQISIASNDEEFVRMNTFTDFHDNSRDSP